MTDTNQAVFNQIPQPDPGLPFRLVEIEDLVLPHPYCITPKHLKYADSMYLNETAIARAESRGAQCDICRKRYKAGKQLEILSFEQHESQKTLFIEVDDSRDLNDIEGLHAYLVRIKSTAEHLGIQGFAFPTRTKDESQPPAGCETMT